MVRKRLELIQFSRALVPFLVMLFHLSGTMMAYFDYNLLGFSFIPISGGVNYFFALSGFMMYYIYRGKFGSNTSIKKLLVKSTYSNLSTLLAFNLFVFICFISLPWF